MGGIFSRSEPDPELNLKSHHYKHTIKDAQIREELQNLQARRQLDNCQCRYENALIKWLKRSRESVQEERASLPVSVWSWNRSMNLRHFSAWVAHRLDVARVGEANYELELYEEFGGTYWVGYSWMLPVHPYFRGWSGDYWRDEVQRARREVPQDAHMCPLEWREHYLEMEIKYEIKRELELIALKHKAAENQIVARQMLQREWTVQDKPSDEEFQTWHRHARRKDPDWSKAPPHVDPRGMTIAEWLQEHGRRGAEADAHWRAKERESRKQTREKDETEWDRNETKTKEKLKEQQRKTEEMLRAQQELEEAERKVQERMQAFEQWLFQCNDVVGNGDKSLIREMTAFPEPPFWPCNTEKCAIEASERHLQACSCNIKELCAAIGAHCTIPFLKYQRRRWHPDNFSGCPVYGAQEKAVELFKVFGEVLDNLK